MLHICDTYENPAKGGTFADICEFRKPRNTHIAILANKAFLVNLVVHIIHNS